MPENSLFRHGPNPQFNACVGNNGGPYGFDNYAEGFFLAGFNTIESIIERKGWNIDLLIYPVVFNFRHGVELYVKFLIRKIYLNQSILLDFPQNHSITQLYELFEKLSKAYEAEIFEPLRVSICKDIVDDFAEIDPRGVEFRYPEDTQGNQTLDDQSRINIEVLRDGMNILFEHLETWSLTMKVLQKGEGLKSLLIK